MLSEELGLQKLLKGREGRPCSGSAGQLIPGCIQKLDLSNKALTKTKSMRVGKKIDAFSTSRRTRTSCDLGVIDSY